MVIAVVAYMFLTPVPTTTPTSAPATTSATTATPPPSTTKTTTKITTKTTTKGPEKFVLSSVFQNNTKIPVKYTCNGEDVSPPLTWKGQPESVVSYVLIVDDPDAPRGTFTHWVLYNIPGSLTSLPENVPKKSVTDYGLQGRNSFGRIGYGGPCPPPGKPHRYIFKLYALDVKLDLGAGATKKQVLRAMEGHIISQTTLIGLYGKS